MFNPSLPHRSLTRLGVLLCASSLWLSGCTAPGSESHRSEEQSTATTGETSSAGSSVDKEASTTGSQVPSTASTTGSSTPSTISPSTISASPTNSRGSSTASTTAGSDTTAGLPPLGTADVKEKTSRPEPPIDLTVTQVRVGSHDTFDRIVFDLAGTGTPGWFINYTTTPMAQGSGHHVHVDGDSFLDVNIDGIVYPFEVGETPKFFDMTELPGPIVAEIRDQGTFEGRNQFIVGLNGTQHPYSVQVLKNPTRLVIDILKR